MSINMAPVQGFSGFSGFGAGIEGSGFPGRLGIWTADDYISSFPAVAWSADGLYVDENVRIENSGSLGAPDARWKDVYIGFSSLRLGDMNVKAVMVNDQSPRPGVAYGQSVGVFVEDADGNRVELTGNKVRKPYNAATAVGQNGEDFFLEGIAVEPGLSGRSGDVILRAGSVSSTGFSGSVRVEHLSNYGFSSSIHLSPSMIESDHEFALKLGDFDSGYVRNGTVRVHDGELEVFVDGKWSTQSGRIGTSGMRGSSGYSGVYSGFSGTSGASGFSGRESGFSGHSGTSGVSGFSGISGFSGTYSGFSGQRGLDGTPGAADTTYLFKNEDQSNNTTVFVIDDDLQFSVSAGGHYVFEYNLFIKNDDPATEAFLFGGPEGTLTDGVKLQVSPPVTEAYWATVDTRSMKGEYHLTTDTSDIFFVNMNSALDFVTYVDNPSYPVQVGRFNPYPIASYMRVTIRGSLEPSSSGAITVRFARETDTGNDLVVMAGSTLVVHEA